MEYLENDKSSDAIRSENNSQRSSRVGSRDTDRKNSLYNEKTAELLHRSALRERNGRSNSETRHLPPKGPTKPAREIDRRRALSKYVLVIITNDWIKLLSKKNKIIIS